MSKNKGLLNLDDWSGELRTHAYCAGRAAWFSDALIEEVNPDFPPFGQLFRFVCAQMPDRWQLDRVEHCVANDHIAKFGQAKGPRFDILFGGFEDGFLFELGLTGNADRSDVEGFLMDLHETIKFTDGITDVKWFYAAMIEAGMSQSQFELGTSTPIEAD